MTEAELRAAGPQDAAQVAQLHAESWRRTYRGAYADSYLDGDLVADRLAVWSARLAAPHGTLTLVAEDGAGLAGFVHLVLDEDDRWGTLVDNLHVRHDRKRGGLGRTLLSGAAAAAAVDAVHRSLYLWVHAQNTAAQGFYSALGGRNVGTAPVAAPGGLPERLNGTPEKYRFAWSEAALLGRAAVAPAG
ncbi:GNAT family N-acetyltransferase [Kitasatospora sp. NPDC059571]|uniref:GNAT family N-acetyltransferase n=1 Tax=Kitasatospora sp. NPDC059571 TaxID=3346871 RepID=UPI0036BC82D8